jgi:DNA helicase-2/ATP-dependent DNA helicase PcrA
VQRGPFVLSRNLVVRDIADIPADWSTAPRVIIDASVVASPGHVIALAEARALARESVVFVIDATVAQNLRLLASAGENGQPHLLGARWTPVHERLQHLLAANSVDLATPSTPRFLLADLALACGARLPRSHENGDVVGPDGTPLWLDGGPVRYTAPVEGVGVVHRVALEHRSLQPFGPGNETSADLAADQRAAVTHAGGAARIIAPAGSGKTRVLTERARHLLRTWRLPASSVCLVAFNKRAQEEMRQRTTDLAGLQVRTLNSLALAIVNGTAPFAPRGRVLRTLDEPEMRRIIGKLVVFPRKRNADPISPWIEALSLARLGLRAPTDVEAMYDGEVDGFADVFPRYRRELAAADTLDFDEQIYRAIEILADDVEARAVAQRACRVLLVDEFQDLTPAHLLLLRLLAGPDAAVFGVGDDDQTIYGYNGADPAWLIDFADLFPGAGDHPLEVNYRCPGGVVSIADRLLRHNGRRVSKVIRAASDEAGGWRIEEAADSVAATVASVHAHLADGGNADDIAVLTRVNSLLVPVQVALALAGVPTTGGVGAEFLERTAVRAALSWLRLATADDRARFSPADVGEALRRPSRPLHPNVSKWVTEQTSLDGLRRLAERLTTEREAERVLSFAADIERLQGMVAAGASTAQLVRTVRDSVGLASSITTLDANRRGMNRAAQGDDLTAIVQLAGLHADPRTFESWLREQLQAPRQPKGITLATVHRVKGQEWPFVVIHHAETDQFPHRLAEDIEEERRLFHVAITRAGRHVTVVVQDRPSPFIAELTTEPSAAAVRQPQGRVHTGAPRPATATATRPSDNLSASGAALFEELRALRRHLAAGKPAYTVLADAALAAIAQQQPRTLAELATIRGIGPTKLDLYGNSILAVVEASISAAS